MSPVFQSVEVLTSLAQALQLREEAAAHAEEQVSIRLAAEAAAAAKLLASEERSALALRHAVLDRDRSAAAAASAAVALAHSSKDAQVREADTHTSELRARLAALDVDRVEEHARASAEAAELRAQLTTLMLRAERAEALADERTA